MALPSDPEDINYRFATKAIHAGCQKRSNDRRHHDAYLSKSTYAQKSPGEPISKYEYSRTANPTRDALETNLAALENGKFALTFASGCAALSHIITNTFPKGKPYRS